MLKSDDFEEFPIETRKFEFFKNENKKGSTFPTRVFNNMQFQFHSSHAINNFQLI